MVQQLNLFDNEADKINQKTTKGILYGYDAFVEKFKPKKTTDDCYTPESVYSALVEYINKNVQPLDGFNIVRPFWPGKNFEAYGYKPDDIVIDNPPFSILSRILDFYIAAGVKFWLFAPHLTLFQYSNRQCTLVCTNSQITYENGAVVSTDFITNLYPDDMWVYVDGKLHDILEKADKNRKPTKKLNKYSYPLNVTTSTELGTYIASHGEDFIIRRNEGVRINKLDCQTSSKTIFGCGILLSNARAEAKARAEANKTKVLKLSEREMNIINKLK